MNQEPEQEQGREQEIDAAQNALQDLNINANPPRVEVAEAIVPGINAVHARPLANQPFHFPPRPIRAPPNRQRRPVLGGQGAARLRAGQNWGNLWGGGREGEHVRGRRVVAREVEAELVDMEAVEG